jgi:surface antigen
LLATPGCRRFQDHGAFMSALKFLAVTAACITLTACASDPSVGPRQESGTVLGAITGGLLGASLGSNTGSRVAGAVIGAAAGGILGGAIGASLDEQERERAYAAEMQALEYGEPGAPVGWRSDRRAEYYGTVVPGPPYQTAGRRCREYSHTVYVNGRPQTARGTACRNPDGTWTPVA